MPANHGHREKLLDAAERLVLSKGFPATKVDEVCAAAGVTKGSFYHHFDAKDDLAKALIDHYFDRLLGALDNDAWSKKRTPKTRALALLDQLLEVMQGPLLRRGCLLGSFALDLSETHPDIRRLIEDRFARLAAMIEPTLRDAMPQRARGGGPTSEALAQQFIAVLQGGIVLAKAQGRHEALGESLGCYRQMVEGVLDAA